MILHIFNPEHDIALASGLSNFTAPHAGRQLRHDLGFLPLLWADNVDGVLVDDAEWCRREWARFRQRVARTSGAADVAICHGQIVPLQRANHIDARRIEPWGWDHALCAQLSRKGISELLLPTTERLAMIRQLSHRRVAAALLPRLRMAGTLGESFECSTAEDVQELLTRYGRLVLKAPWSSSGRGLRFVDVERTPLDLHAGWLKNLFMAQGSVMVEPYYDKVRDLGMEFYSDGEGRVTYLGLSLFHTMNGAYTGNILATEEEKLRMLSRYNTVSLLFEVQSNICDILGPEFKGKYEGPFGVDMMLCASGNSTFLLHPCVEINLRRTMGHVALRLAELVNPQRDDEVVRVMRIVYENNQYQLKLEKR